jgi:hypothetical protein
MDSIRLLPGYRLADKPYGCKALYLWWAMGWRNPKLMAWNGMIWVSDGLRWLCFCDKAVTIELENGFVRQKRE